MTNSFNYIGRNPMMNLADYPYTGTVDTCKYDWQQGEGYLLGFDNISPDQVNQIRSALNIGPVSVAIEADEKAFQFYNGGVITTGCGQKLNHAVLVVGYGGEDETPYFLVKNSWGTSWGLEGYVKIGANSENVCGILSDPSFVIE
jgi:hypothetical protein